ncbi:hypothetical protein PIB30_059489 [Stylosanthes scabra]|uniref:Uncharacterized protein n=1 Tax=Stylosanthes scabra TaxID=79078 RepID=A0ABU6TMD2_9FABA|nr:hypothetical protein [Stylosanthes scabra]
MLLCPWSKRNPNLISLLSLPSLSAHPTSTHAAARRPFSSSCAPSLHCPPPSLLILFEYQEIHFHSCEDGRGFTSFKRKNHYRLLHLSDGALLRRSTQILTPRVLPPQ